MEFFFPSQLDKTFIPISECRDGYVYYISARNAIIGIYRESTKGFIIARNKFGSIYLFEEYHWDTGEPFGTVQPWAELEKAPDFPPDDAMGSNPNKLLFLLEVVKRYDYKRLDLERMIAKKVKGIADRHFAGYNDLLARYHAEVDTRTDKQREADRARFDVAVMEEILKQLGPEPEKPSHIDPFSKTEQVVSYLEYMGRRGKLREKLETEYKHILLGE